MPNSRRSRYQPAKMYASTLSTYKIHFLTSVSSQAVPQQWSPNAAKFNGLSTYDADFTEKKEEEEEDKKK